MFQLIKFSISLSLLLLFAISGYAQIGVGMQVGLLNSNFAYNDDDALAKVQSDERVGGYVLGAFIEGVLSRKFSIQSELNLKRTGSTRIHLAELDAIQSVEERVSRRFNFVEVPVLLKYNSSFKSAFNRVTISVLAGPSFSYARNATGNTTRFFAGVPSGDGMDYDIEFKEERINRVDFGGQIGLQLGIQAGNGRFIFDTRYRQGFINMNDGINENRFGSVEDYATTTRSIAFTIGYQKIFGQKAETY